MGNKEQKKAVVFGLFETGLGVARALGRRGIDVIGIDHIRDIGCFSRYVKPMRCPHPVNENALFLEWVDTTFKGQPAFPAFLTSDIFLFTFSKNRGYLSKYFLFNLPTENQLEAIADKYSQYLLAIDTGVKVPKTWMASTPQDLEKLKPEFINWPLFIKGRDVNAWRAHFGGTVKGFSVGSYEELLHQLLPALEQKIPVILQEVILGPDTNHFKYCAYISKEGITLAEFCLRKIRQNPIRFGIGAVVESIDYPDLVTEGRKLLKGINYHGVGSAEFKLDQRDGQLKLIELNPRYWQQNILTEACGINFALLNFEDLTNEHAPAPLSEYKVGIKWVNIYMDFDSFLKYWKAGEITFREWIGSLRGPKVFSDFASDDVLPAFWEIRFGWKFFRLPIFLWKRLWGKSHS